MFQRNWFICFPTFAYQQLAELIPWSKSWTPSHELKISKREVEDDNWEVEDEDEDDKPLGAWQIQFKTLDTYQEVAHVCVRTRKREGRLDGGEKKEISSLLGTEYKTIMLAYIIGAEYLKYLCSFFRPVFN